MTDPVSADTTTESSPPEQPAPDKPAAATPLPGAPKPGVPRPGPAKPGGGPRPSALKTGTSASHTPAPTTAAPVSDPSKFGRVDEDGSAWVRTAEGDRQIGSWQAGDAAEGLAHFGRRYDDLVTEVTLLEARLASGSGDAKKTKAAAVALSASIPTASVIGDLDAVLARLAAIIEHSDAAAAAAKIARDEERAKHTDRKEELAAEAEAIGTESTQWKVAGDRLRQILDEWKTIRGVDRKVDDALWKRYSKARENFNRRRGAYFADLDRERGAAKSRKEELVEQAKALSTSTDWTETSAAFRELLNEWKAAGRAPRDADDTLWKNFKGAQDVFFQARNEAASERDAEFDGNAAAKEALLVKFGSIDPDNGMDAARASLRDLQDQWDAIGKVPREKMQELEGKLRAIEKRVRDAVDSQWRRSDPEAVARAAQFSERASQFEEQARKATAAGKTKDAQKAADQAQQWREWADAAEGAIDGL